MEYAGRVCCDADSHIMETVDWVSRFADPDIRDRLPPMALGAAGNATLELLDPQGRSRRIGRTPPSAQPGSTWDNGLISGPKGWGAYGAFDIAERKRALDDLGFRRQLVFSTFAGTQYLNATDPDLLYGGLRAHNRAMADFCGHDPRLIGVGQVSLVRSERARWLESRGRPEAGDRRLLDAVRAGRRGFTRPRGLRSDLADPIGRPRAVRAPYRLGGALLPRSISRWFNDRPAGAQGLHGRGRERARERHDRSSPQRRDLHRHPGPGRRAGASSDPARRRDRAGRGLGAVQVLRRLDWIADIWERSEPDTTVAGLTMKPSEYIRRAVRFTPFRRSRTSPISFGSRMSGSICSRATILTSRAAAPRSRGFLKRAHVRWASRTTSRTPSTQDNFARLFSKQHRYLRRAAVTVSGRRP